MLEGTKVTLGLVDATNGCKSLSGITFCLARHSVKFVTLAQKRHSVEVITPEVLFRYAADKKDRCRLIDSQIISSLKKYNFKDCRRKLFPVIYKIISDE